MIDKQNQFIGGKNEDEVSEVRETTASRQEDNRIRPWVPGES